MTKKASAARSVLGWLLLAACLMLAGAACLVGYHPPERTTYAATGRHAQVLGVPVQQGSISVNLADAATLEQLPGVGSTIAAAVVEEREKNGAFFYPEDLLQVRGIGEKKLGILRELLDMKEE